MSKTASSEALAKALRGATATATSKADDAKLAADEIREKAGTTRVLADRAAATLKRTETALGARTAELGVATAEHSRLTNLKKPVASKVETAKAAMDEVQKKVELATKLRDDAKAAAEPLVAQANSLSKEAEDAEQVAADALEAQEEAVAKAGGHASADEDVAADRVKAMLAKDDQISAKDIRIAELEAKLTAAAPGKSVGGTDVETFLEALGDGKGILSRVNELTKVQSRRLSDEKAKFFNEHRSLTHDNESNDIMGTDLLREFIRRRCVELQHAAPWLWQIVMFVETNTDLRACMNLLVAWAGTFAPKEVLPIKEGMGAVRGLLNLLAAMFTRLQAAIDGIDYLWLDLSLDAQLRTVRPEVIVAHTGELKLVGGRHPIKIQMEAAGVGFLEQRPMGVMGAVVPGMATDTGGFATVLASMQRQLAELSRAQTRQDPVRNEPVAMSAEAMMASMQQQIAELSRPGTRHDKRSRDDGAAAGPIAPRLLNPTRKCDTCKGKGHEARECVPRDKATLREGVCDRCGGNRHIKAMCPSKLDR